MERNVRSKSSGLPWMDVTLLLFPCTWTVTDTHRAPWCHTDATCLGPSLRSSEGVTESD